MALSPADKAKIRPTLTALTEEVEHLEQARALLERIYTEIGPYEEGSISSRTWTDVRNFFGFDDSE